MTSKKKKKRAPEAKRAAAPARPSAKRAPSAPPPAASPAPLSARSPLAVSVPPPSSRDASTLQAAAEGIPEEGDSPPPSTPSRASTNADEHAMPTDLEIDGVELAGDFEEVTPEDPARGDGDSDDADVADRIRELEQRLDQMIDEAARRGGAGAGAFGSQPTSRAGRPSPPSRRELPSDDGEGTVLETAKELLSTDFYLRKWGRLGMRNRSEEVDDFGFDPVYEEKVLPFFSFLYEKYFRVEVEGAPHVPGDGRCLLVANHSGTLPYDGMMMKLAVKREHPQHRDVRWLAEDFIFHFPFLGSFMNRVGAVRACQENAERLLRQEALVAVFPEGVKGIGKLFTQRYRLQRFGRGGFVKLALRTRTPIVPVAVVGAEEANPMLFRIEYLTKALGLPYFPITPTFPLLGPLGLAPAPTKWKIHFGEPVSFDGYGPEAADDEILVGRLAERVRGAIQGTLDRMLGERRSVWFG